MRKRNSALLLGVALIAILLATSTSHALQSALVLADPETTSTSQHGTLTLTIYQNQNLALIEDERVLELTNGTFELPVRGLSGLLIPESIQLKALENPNALFIQEQRFLTDPADAWAILRDHIGDEIEVYANGGAETFRGVLVGLNGGVLLRDDENQMHLIQDATRFSFPANEMHGPTLLWRVQSALQGPVPVSISYLTSGLNWSADYALVLDSTGQSVDLKSWVSIANGTGLDLYLPDVNLISGQINRSSSPERDFAPEAAAPMVTKLGDVSQQSVFEYHEYSLPQPALLADGETAQVAFLAMAAIPVTKTYIFEAHRYNGVQVWISFENPKSEDRPLPAGLVRMYQDLPDGQRFIGEDAIGHTPVGEELRLLTGLAFDLVGTRTLLSQTRSDEYVYRDTVQIELTNRKSEPAMIQVREQLNGDWKILESSLNYTRLDAYTAEFNVALAPDETKTIEYIVEYHY